MMYGISECAIMVYNPATLFGYFFGIKENIKGRNIKLV